MTSKHKARNYGVDFKAPKFFMHGRFEDKEGQKAHGGLCAGQSRACPSCLPHLRAKPKGAMHKHPPLRGFRKNSGGRQNNNPSRSIQSAQCAIRVPPIDSRTSSHALQFLVDGVGLESQT